MSRDVFSILPNIYRGEFLQKTIRAAKSCHAAEKTEFSIKDSSVNVTSVTFTEEIPNGKLRFLFIVSYFCKKLNHSCLTGF